MKRRGNKSNKVPNVKLRPAPPKASSSRESQDSWLAQDTQPSDVGTSVPDLCPRPFKSVVLCATGIADKPTLFKQAIELGATSVSAFTDRVTHLVAEEHGGAKYTCALERKIPILKSSWITESYQIWLRGDDVDLDESIAKHRLPVFSGVVMTISGIDDVVQRTRISKLLAQQDGSFVVNLERPVKVTHLLCSGDEETEKMLYANKFNARKEAHIHLVWEEWFWDSLEFGGRFDETRYAVNHPRPERKSKTQVHRSSPTSDVPPPPSDPSSSFPLGNAGDDDEDEPEEVASVKRPPELALQVWESLLRPRGYYISAGKLVRDPAADLGTGPPPRPSSPARIPPSRGGKGSIISSFRRANSFAPPPKEPVAGSSHQPFRRTTTLPAFPSAPHDKGVAESSKMAAAAEAVSSCPSLFAGLTFRVLGEARCANVRSAIEGSGGRTVPENGPDDEVDYIIVRLVSGSKFFRAESDEQVRLKYRTECWLEWCIYHERICSPDEHISFRPLEIETPVPGAEEIRMSLSGFSESECWPLRRITRALGITQIPNFSRQATHLLCPSGTGAKFQKALEWNVPVVNMHWLVDMVTTGVICLSSRHIVSGPDEPRVIDADKDGHRMADITNNAGRSQGKKLPAEESPPSIPSSQREKPPDGTSTNSSQVSLEYLTEPCASFPGASSQKTASTSRQPSLNEIPEEVPSSKSPSPMKMPGSGRREGSVSPAKVPCEITRALQDSITSLLGKRQTGEEDLGVKIGKRPRAPLRSKASREFISSSPSRSASPGDVSDAAVSIDEDMDDEEAEESMCVMYEDPGQMDEKKRLMSLLGGAVVGKGEGREKKRKNPKGVRRSSRRAGF